MLTFPSRVIIIDDLFEEADPLIRALRVEGTSVLYFTGKMDDLPRVPLLGVRVVFLDLRLFGMEGQPIKAVVSALIGVLQKTISETNGPYVIIAWTKHLEDLSDVSGALEPLQIKPLVIIPMSKQECRTDPAAPYDLILIREKLMAKMAELGAATLLLRWEELVRAAAGEVARDLCSKPGSIVTNVAALFHKLAIASAGKAVEEMAPDALGREALFAMTGMLIDTLERTICAADGITFQPRIGDTEAAIDDAELNARLLTSASLDDSRRPGMVFRSHEEKPVEFLARLLRSNLQPAFLKVLNAPSATVENGDGKTPIAKEEKQASKRREEYESVFNDLRNSSRLVTVIVTPYCDYGQKKALRTKVCSGVLWPDKYRGHLQQRSEFLYITPVLRLTVPMEGRVFIVIDLRTIDGCEEDALKNPVLALRRELVLDIQNKLARQSSRPGITAITD